MNGLFDVNRLRRLLAGSVERWHGGPIIHDEREPFWRLVAQLQAHNFELWHEEDKARDPAARAQEIVRVKRNIDGFNQQRNDTIEGLDEAGGLILDTSSGRRVLPLSRALDPEIET